MVELDFRFGRQDSLTKLQVICALAAAAFDPKKTSRKLAEVLQMPLDKSQGPNRKQGTEAKSMTDLMMFLP